MPPRPDTVLGLSAFAACPFETHTLRMENTEREERGYLRIDVPVGTPVLCAVRGAFGPMQVRRSPDVGLGVFYNGRHPYFDEPENRFLHGGELQVRVGVTGVTPSVGARTLTTSRDAIIGGYDLGDEVAYVTGECRIKTWVRWVAGLDGAGGEWITCTTWPAMRYWLRDEGGYYTVLSPEEALALAESGDLATAVETARSSGTIPFSESVFCRSLAWWTEHVGDIPFIWRGAPGMLMLLPLWSSGDAGAGPSAFARSLCSIPDPQ